MNRVPLAIATMIFVTVLTIDRVASQQNLEADVLELQICRRGTSELRERIRVLSANRCVNDAIPADAGVRSSYNSYLASFYSQQSKLMEINVRVLEWQIMASNFVLAMVVLLVSSGVIFAGYQLFRAAATSTADSSSVNMEISSQRIKLQTSVVGIVVLIISGAFLLLFLNNVYKIELLDQSRSSHRDKPAENASQ